MHADSQTVKQQFKSNAFEKKDRFQNCNLVDNRTSYLHQRNLASLIQRATCPKQIPSQSPSEKVIQRVPLDQFIINMSQKHSDEDIYLYGHVAGDGFGDTSMLNNLEQVLLRHKEPLKIANIIKIATLDDDDNDADIKERAMREKYNFQDVKKVNQIETNTESLLIYIFVEWYNNKTVTISNQNDAQDDIDSLRQIDIDSLRQYEDTSITEILQKSYKGIYPLEFQSFIAAFKNYSDEQINELIINHNTVYPQLHYYPAYCAREKISTYPINSNNWEMHCSIPDLDSMQQFYNSPKFTVISEMGKIHTFEYLTDIDSPNTNDTKTDSSYTTLLYNDLYPPRSAGLMLPDHASTECKIDNIPADLLTFLKITSDEYMSPSKFTESYAFINLRTVADGKKRPDANTIRSFVSKLNGPLKLILLGVSDMSNETDPNICCINSLDGGVLQHFLTKMTPNSIVLSGGEGLFCEALGLSEAKTMLIPRYEYHYRALLSFGRKMGKQNEIEALIKESMNTVGMSLDTVNEYLTNHSDTPIAAEGNTDISPTFLQEISSLFKSSTLDKFIETTLESQCPPSIQQPLEQNPPANL